jgi:hypothetical protein
MGGANSDSRTNDVRRIGFPAYQQSVQSAFNIFGESEFAAPASILFTIFDFIKKNKS